MFQPNKPKKFIPLALWNNYSIIGLLKVDMLVGNSFV
jgi:hypothetical protein